MKIKAGVNFHNRFDIVKNGEWVGYAENIILDQMYTRLTSTNTFFVNIHFGTGTGTPSPERTTLFSHLGTKEAVDEERIQAFPTSKWVRKIVLNPEEFVGQTITEVGIAFGGTASNLVTHAMIKDAEGQPLSITKSALDVIEIYATLYIILEDSDTAVFQKRADWNTLVRYLTGISTFPTRMYLAASHYCGNENINLYTESVLEMTKSVVGRNLLYSGRIPIDSKNLYNRLEVLSLIEGIVSYDVGYGVMNTTFARQRSVSERILAKGIGVGDGVTTEYIIPYSEIKNTEVLVGGVVVDPLSYQIESEIGKSAGYLPLRYLIDWSEEPDSLLATYPPKGYNYSYRASSTWYRTGRGKIDGSKLLGKRILVTSQGGGYVTSTTTVSASVDGVNWTTLVTCAGSSYVEALSDPIVVNYNYIEIYIRGYNASGGAEHIGTASVVTDYEGSKLTFNDPVPQDELIEINTDVDYFPKTEDFVMDVVFEIQFGEGV